MSAEAWQKLGAPLSRPWTVPIRMANDEPIRVLGISEEMQVAIADLTLPISFIVVESLGEDDFLLGRTFIRDFDVLIDLSKGSILVRDPKRERNLKRKEVIGSYSERMKLILDSSTKLKPKDVTLCRLKLTGAAGHFKNDRQICILPIKDGRRERGAVSQQAGRSP